jgi:hypothetical protein
MTGVPRGNTSFFLQEKEKEKRKKIVLRPLLGARDEKKKMLRPLMGAKRKQKNCKY